MAGMAGGGLEGGAAAPPAGAKPAAETLRPAETLRDRTYIGLVLSQFLAAFNDQATHIVAIFYATDMLVRHVQVAGLDSKAVVLLVTTCFIAPFVLFSSLAGVLADRFVNHFDTYFRFITTPGVPPTNNLAEQAIRFVAIHRRITHGTRGENGRRWCERMWSVIATCGQQGRSSVVSLVRANHKRFHLSEAEF